MSDSIWINTGELSGDMHGAMLMRALQKKAPNLTFAGMGGPHLREAGLESVFQVEDLSVMGLTEVFAHLPKIFRLIRGITKELERRRPKALVVVDAPDFNFRVIKAARRLNIPVYYYISPKIWAWRQSRARFIKRHVRRLISILPFEADFYRKYDMEIDYVGNPLVDMIDLEALDAVTPEKNMVGLLPGSRNKEITTLLPEFSKAAGVLMKYFPALSFSLVRAPNMPETFLREHWQTDAPLVIEEPGDRWRFMRRCHMLIAASGTATLESALIGTPTLVAYKVSPLSFFLGKRLVKVPYISLPNLILGKETFPELLQEKCDAGPLAKSAMPWLGENAESLLAPVRQDLATLRQMLGKPGAVDRAADVILSDLN